MPIATNSLLWYYCSWLTSFTSMRVGIRSSAVAIFMFYFGPSLPMRSTQLLSFACCGWDKVAKAWGWPLAWNCYQILRIHGFFIFVIYFQSIYESYHLPGQYNVEWYVHSKKMNYKLWRCFFFDVAFTVHHVSRHFLFTSSSFIPFVN